MIESFKRLILIHRQYKKKKITLSIKIIYNYSYDL